MAGGDWSGGRATRGLMLAIAVVLGTALVAAATIDEGAPSSERTTVAVSLDERFATPAAPGTVIDRATAQRVVDFVWPLRARALHDHHAATVKRLETGAAAENDVAFCTAGCPAPPVIPATGWRFTAPPQQGYPAFFLAEAQTRGPYNEPAIELMVFTRSSAAAPWLLTVDTNFDALGRVSGRVIDGAAVDNFAAAPPSLGGLDPATLPGLLGAYWQSWKDTGRPPAQTPLTTAGYLADHGPEIWQFHQALAAHGVHETVRYYADPKDGPYVFSLGETSLACGAVRWQVHYEPATAGATLEQSADREFSAMLEPGQYRTITAAGLRQSCFRLYPADGIDVLGENGGDTVSSGTRQA